MRSLYNDLTFVVVVGKLKKRAVGWKEEEDEAQTDIEVDAYKRIVTNNFYSLLKGIRFGHVT